MDETVTSLRELYIFVSTQNNGTPKAEKGEKKLTADQVKEIEEQQEKLLKSFRMSLLWYGAMLVIYMDVAKITDWTTSNDGLMDRIGERVANYPFGDDFSDLKLRKRFLTPLIEDFKTYGKALEKDGSKSDRAQLLALESENPVANLPNDDGEADDTADK